MKRIGILFFLFCFLVMVLFSCDCGSEGESKSKSGSSSTEAQTPAITCGETIVNYQTGAAASALIIAAVVSDNGTLSYQWYQSSNNVDYTLISGETLGLYTPSTAVAGIFYYRCTVTNTKDGKIATVDSDVFTVNITDSGNAELPVITGEKIEAYNYAVGASATALTITAAVTDGGTLSYQWFGSLDNREFTAVSGQTSSSFIPSTSTPGTHYYRCTVTNRNSGKISASSNSKVFTVITTAESDTAQYPAITGGGGTVSYLVDAIAEQITITATVTDGGTLSYQWYKSSDKTVDYGIIENETEASYTPPTNTVGIFYYYCFVTNQTPDKEKKATSLSQVFTVSVTAANEPMPPTIKPLENIETELQKTVTLSVLASTSDGGTLSYQWYRSSTTSNFTLMTSAESSSLKITTTEPGTVYYCCRVTNRVVIGGEAKTACSEVVASITVTSGTGGINIDFNN